MQFFKLATVLSFAAAAVAAPAPAAAPEAALEARTVSSLRIPFHPITCCLSYSDFGLIGSLGTKRLQEG